MSIFKALADKLAQKKKEAEREAAKKVAEMAFEQSKQAAKSAVLRAGKSLEDALFGDDEAPTSSPRPSSVPPPPKAAPKPSPKAPPPKVDRAREEAELEAQVDRDLAALKKKHGK